MTQEQKIIRAKVGLLELAKQLGNVSQACKMMGYSRDSFYRFKRMRAFVVKFDLISASLSLPYFYQLLSVAFDALQVRSRCGWRHYANKLVYGWRFGQNHDAAFASFARPQGASPICTAAASHLLERRSATLEVY